MFRPIGREFILNDSRLIFTLSPGNICDKI